MRLVTLLPKRGPTCSDCFSHSSQPWFDLRCLHLIGTIKPRICIFIITSHNNKLSIVGPIKPVKMLNQLKDITIRNIFSAAETGNLKKVELFVQQGVGVNVQQKWVCKGNILFKIFRHFCIHSLKAG